MMTYDRLLCLDGREILIYGAGVISRQVVKCLGQASQLLPHPLRIIGIAVTAEVSTQQFDDTSLCIRSIRAWKTYCPSNTTVLIATMDRYHKEIAAECRKNGFYDFIPLSPELRDDIVSCYFEHYLQQRGVRLCGKYLELGSAKFLNPLTQELYSGRASIFLQFADIVFPHVWPDWNMVYEGPYDPKGILNLHSADVVLDLGANAGTFSVYAASKGCICYAFEPMPELLCVLQQQAETAEIIPVPYAVGDKIGSATLHLSTYGPGSNSLLRRTNSYEDIVVDMITVDAFVQNNHLHSVDFIKADIEGAERLMLMGAQKTLAEFAPKLSLCTYHCSDDKEVLTNLILQANPHYRIEYHWEKLYAYIPEEA